jgi:hypothetical protein
MGHAAVKTEVTKWSWRVLQRRSRPRGIMGFYRPGEGKTVRAFARMPAHHEWAPALGSRLLLSG